MRQVLFNSNYEASVQLEHLHWTQHEWAKHLLSPWHGSPSLCDELYTSVKFHKGACVPLHRRANPEHVRNKKVTAPAAWSAGAATMLSVSRSATSCLWMWTTYKEGGSRVVVLVSCVNVKKEDWLCFQPAADKHLTAWQTTADRSHHHQTYTHTLRQTILSDIQLYMYV